MKALIRRAGLTGPAFRALERAKAIRGVRNPKLGDDGLPLPPPLLMVRVVGHADAEAFQSYGAQAATIIHAAVNRHGRTVGAMVAVLDFGCGCGRVLRHWRRLDPPKVVHGSDLNADAIGWVKENLPGVEAGVNGLEPPLGYADETFDLVYALSVFTHLDENLNRRWITELRRVLKPRGMAFITIKGDQHAEDELPAELLARYRAGEFVTTYEEVQGSNLCAAYSNADWTTRELLDGFDVLEHRNHGRAMMGGQDAYLAVKR